MTSQTLTTQLPYQDPALSIPERVADLLSRMTLEEKVGQMLQLDARDDIDDHIARRHAGSILHTSPERILRANELTAQTRLRIRCWWRRTASTGTRSGRERRSTPRSSAWPRRGIPTSSSASPAATAEEVAVTGIHWTFSPVLCIARDLRWGRIDETFGEDPFLIGELASAMVRGYQGDGLDDPTAILATAKHFAGYSETQGGRDASEADISRRKLRSWFLPPFERVAREGCRTFMLGYQTTDGVPITTNDWLLSDVLRGEWGYTGTLITDWDNVGRMVWEQRIQPDITHAAAAAVRAGNDMIMTTPSFFEGALEAVWPRACSPTTRSMRRPRASLTLKFELGLFENPASSRNRARRRGGQCGARRAEPRGRPTLAGAARERRCACRSTPRRR